MEMNEAMAMGAARYADALEELRRVGRAVFTQTGGMCAALELTLERGYLLITDAEDSLPWSRAELTGWGVGFYPSQDAGDGPEVFVDTSITSVHGLRGAIEQCLQEAASARGPTRDVLHRTPKASTDQPRPATRGRGSVFPLM